MSKFRKGASGNAGGRPKVLGELQELARFHAPDAIAELVRVLSPTLVDCAAA